MLSIPLPRPFGDYELLEEGSSQGSALFTAVAGKHALKKWNLLTLKEEGYWRTHSASLVGLALSDDGRLLAAGLGDGSIELWDMSGDPSPKTFMGQWGYDLPYYSEIGATPSVPCDSLSSGHQHSSHENNVLWMSNRHGLLPRQITTAACQACGSLKLRTLLRPSPLWTRPSGPINSGAFFVAPLGFAQDDVWGDLQTDRHIGSANLSFVDGHVAPHHW